MVTPNNRDMREKDSQFFEQDAKPRDFCSSGGQGAIFNLNRRARHSCLLFCKPRNGASNKKNKKTSGGAMVSGMTSLVYI